MAYEESQKYKEGKYILEKVKPAAPGPWAGWPGWHDIKSLRCLIPPDHPPQCRPRCKRRGHGDS